MPAGECIEVCWLQRLDYVAVAEEELLGEKADSLLQDKWQTVARGG